MTSNSELTNPLQKAYNQLLGHCLVLVDWLRQRPKVMFSLIGLLLLAIIGIISSGPSEAEKKAILQKEIELSLTPVVVAVVRQGNLNIYQFGLGVVTPFNTVEISSRVDGQLMNIAFEEGEMVKQGDLLAQIDPLPFEVVLRQAKGQLALDKTLLHQAQVSLKRYKKLLKQDSTSLQLVNAKESEVHQYLAAVEADQGKVTSAELQLKYAAIIAPISGRVGFRRVAPGTILRASGNTVIVKITQLDPISVVFPIPEDTLPRVMKLLASAEDTPVDVYDRALKQKISEGRLLAVDNQIDVTTGTIKLKAELANADHALFPNQFVNVRMAIEKRANATLVPTAAIQRGSPGTFVYAVQEDRTVKVVVVKIGPSQGEITVIEKGLSTGTIVVVEGADSLRAGAQVKIVPGDSAASDSGEY